MHPQREDDQKSLESLADEVKDYCQDCLLLQKLVRFFQRSPDGKFLASGSKDNRIIFWKIQPEISKNPYRFLEGHEFIVNDVLFSNEGKKLISVSN